MSKAAAKRYRKWISEQPCAASGLEDGTVDWHHVIGVGFGKTGRKASPDWATIPLAHKYHMGDQGIHNMGVMSWQEIYGHQLKHLGWTLVCAHKHGLIEVKFT